MTIAEIVAEFQEQFAARTKVELTLTRVGQYASQSYDLVYIDWIRPERGFQMWQEDRRFVRLIDEAVRVAKKLVVISTRDELRNGTLHGRTFAAAGAMRRMAWAIRDYRLIGNDRFPVCVLGFTRHHEPGGVERSTASDRTDRTVGALSGRDMRRLTRTPL